MLHCIQLWMIKVGELCVVFIKKKIYRLACNLKLVGGGGKWAFMQNSDPPQFCLYNYLCQHLILDFVNLIN